MNVVLAIVVVDVAGRGSDQCSPADRPAADAGAVEHVPVLFQSPAHPAARWLPRLEASRAHEKRQTFFNLSRFGFFIVVVVMQIPVVRDFIRIAGIKSVALLAAFFMRVLKGPGN